MIGAYPVVVVLLSMIFLGERLQLTQVAGIACAVIGVVLVSVGN